MQSDMWQQCCTDSAPRCTALMTPASQVAKGAPKRAGMNAEGTTSRGLTASRLKPARLFTERRIMVSAIFMRGRGIGIGMRCSCTRSSMSSVSLAKGLSSTCAVGQLQVWIRRATNPDFGKISALQHPQTRMPSIRHGPVTFAAARKPALSGEPSLLLSVVSSTRASYLQGQHIKLPVQLLCPMPAELQT